MFVCQHKVMLHIILDVPENGSLNHEISYQFGQSTGSYATWHYITNNTHHILQAHRNSSLLRSIRDDTVSVLYLMPKRIERNTVFAYSDSFGFYLINAPYKPEPMSMEDKS